MYSPDLRGEQEGEDDGAGGAGDHAGEGPVLPEEVDEHQGLVAPRLRGRAQEAGEVGDGVVPEALLHEPRQVPGAQERVRPVQQPAAR